MLAGSRSNPIIVGAYTDRDGGVCPMLAAHRNGGRTSFASFARAWDRYTRAGAAPRRATEREVRTLKTMLEASIATEDVRGGGALSARPSPSTAAAQARRAPARGARREAEPAPDTGERDRTDELSQRRGWAWLRPFRRLDEYERAVEELGLRGGARAVRATASERDALAPQSTCCRPGRMNCSSGTMHAGEVRSR